MSELEKPSLITRTTRWGGFGVLIFALSLFIPNFATGQQAPNFVPQYDKSGRLKVPTGYETWVFVGSNIGLGYAAELPAMTAKEAKRVETGSFHNIYINPAAHQHFIETGEFPDPTVLVMEHYEAKGKQPEGILDKGVFNGARSGFEVAVKNPARPDGSKTPWAYYIFTDRKDPSQVKPVAKAFPDAACFSCHEKHASTDNVWVQFYPVLRKHLK
ncbi:cytochrome P460 family protein [Anderseniella sp. Alg231-50]|uniref:cytochrome P460 family protein n=1 Tax=Anderseniella sp. Alg231-50 TaxID=1922226 RepID=UPI000D557C68